MTDTSATLVQGTLDMLILKTLALEPLHGWGISQRIQQLSRGYSTSTLTLSFLRSAG
jgi:DNA-binding PadR family transcriptional regulator